MRYNEKELQALSRQPAELAAELGMRGPKKGSGEWGRGCEPGTGRGGVPVGAGWAVAEPARARPVSTVVKRRLVKLVVNFLFYFRTDEAEVGRREGGPRAGVGELGSPDGPPIRLVCPQPVGALLLEHCRVTQEEPSGFSISFIEDPERKYHFECYSEEQCQEWMGALRRASYEFMRRSLIFYRNEIQKMTGKVCMGHGKWWWWWGEFPGQSSCYPSITQDPLEQFGISEEARFQLSGLKA
ncbi:Pleckstrin like proteiny domain-containing family J member 1 [Myotis davidii]|uniref:Sesquipedalian n=1 Tax=Myotis davidii TaxID=225400 RepID=L5LRG4_MYODS|nr:Pleckstrin like proteiny domain-containing family J member 1 [Myotis davidii]